MIEDDLKQAVALFYDGKNTPTVTAKGEGQTAEQIIAIAQEHNIAFCENKPLSDLLMTLELGEKIPENLYLAIAHIIAFAYQLDSNLNNRRGDNISTKTHDSRKE